MVCNNCGEILIADSDYTLWCPKCSPRGKVFSQEETIEKLKNQIEAKIKEIKYFIARYDLDQQIRFLHQNRNRLRETFFNDYFSCSMGIGIILKLFYKIENINPRKISSENSIILLKLCKNLYLDKHHLYFTNFDAIRLVKYDNPEMLTFKYSENWLPIFKRLYLFGSLPQDPDVISSLGLNLFSELQYHQIILKELHKNYNQYEEISSSLDLLQNYKFQYPWNNYLKFNENMVNINYFLTISKKLRRKNEFSRYNRRIFSDDEIDYIEKKWISSPDSSSEFPIIVQIGEIWLNPNIFFDLTSTIYNTFSSNNVNIYRHYQNHRGHALEDRIFFDLHVYNLDFYSQSNSKIELKRFENPYKTGTELIDIGAIDHKSEKFYVIECKNKVKIRFSQYNPYKLQKYIQKDFKKFKDRDIPIIKKLMTDWNIDSYELVPMFYNFVPLYGEFNNLKEFSPIDGIFIIQNFAEIGTIIFQNFRKAQATFYEVFNIPNDFFRIMADDYLNTKINPSIGQDYGVRIGKPSEKYLIEPGIFEKIDYSQYFPEFWIKIDKPPYILYLDIPPENLPSIEKLNIKKRDKVSVLLYRMSPHVQVMILGKVWKL